MRWFDLYHQPRRVLADTLGGSGKYGKLGAFHVDLQSVDWAPGSFDDRIDGRNVHQDCEALLARSGEVSKPAISLVEGNEPCL